MMAATKTSVLLRALRETLWMARRYASGRSTGAPDNYNTALKSLLDAGYTPEDLGLWPDDDLHGPADKSIWARGGVDWPYDLIKEYGGHEFAEFDLDRVLAPEYLPSRAYLRDLADAPRVAQQILHKFPPTHVACHRQGHCEEWYMYDFNQSWGGAHICMFFYPLPKEDSNAPE